MNFKLAYNINSTNETPECRTLVFNHTIPSCDIDPRKVKPIVRETDLARKRHNEQNINRQVT